MFDAVSENGRLKKRHYFDGRGRAEPIRWMLEETGTPYTENIIRTRDDMSRYLILKSQSMFTLECLGVLTFENLCQTAVVWQAALQSGASDGK